jgi:hypothetical protein
MLTLADYWMGRDMTHGLELSTVIRKNAELMIDLADKLLILAKTHGVTLEHNPRTKTIVSSGWRPPSYNATVPGAAPKSRHMTGQAIDLYDPDGDLDGWAFSDIGQRVLTDLGLWLEHPACTKGWCHVQSVPPKSGRRVFYP